MMADREVTDPNSHALADTLSGLARAAGRCTNTDGVLHDFALQARAARAVDGVGVSRYDGANLRFVTSIDARVAALEQAQEDAQCGPGIDACRSGNAVIVGDLNLRRGRWVDYEAAAMQAGVAAIACIPLRLDVEPIGVLSLFSSAPCEWSTDQGWATRLLADMATSYVLNASELDHQRKLTAQLQEALASRIVIEQAKGIIAAERGASVDAAFDVLRRHARSHGTPLRDIAHAVVRRNLRP